ncbi:MAG: hypothetical protein ACOC3V_02600 [bacterium]
MNSTEYDKLAKSLLLDDYNEINNFLKNYIEKNLVDNLNKYDLVWEIGELLKNLSEFLPQISGSFDMEKLADDKYNIKLYDLIDEHNGELYTRYEFIIKYGR